MQSGVASPNLDNLFQLPEKPGSNRPRITDSGFTGKNICKRNNRPNPTILVKETTPTSYNNKHPSAP